MSALPNSRSKNENEYGPREWSFPFYSQFDMRESEAAHGYSYAGLPVAEANSIHVINDTNLILVNSVNLQLLLFARKLKMKLLHIFVVCALILVQTHPSDVIVSTAI